jgi:hypothetical protein
MFVKGGFGELSRGYDRDPGEASPGSLIESLRPVVNVGRVATVVRSATERELAQRTEALNSRLLILHGGSSPYVNARLVAQLCSADPGHMSTVASSVPGITPRTTVNEG